MQSFKGPRPMSVHEGKSSSRRSQKRFEAVQEQVDEITDIMRHNMDQIIDRDIKLSELDDRMANVSEKAKLFQTTTKKIEKKFWKRNLKLIVITATLILILLAVIGFSLYIGLS